MTGEKGSSDLRGANKFVNDLMIHLLECNYLPAVVLIILFNIDECGLQWKCLPKRTYKSKSAIVLEKKNIE